MCTLFLLLRDRIWLQHELLTSSYTQCRNNYSVNATYNLFINTGLGVYIVKINSVLDPLVFFTQYFSLFFISKKQILAVRSQAELIKRKRVINKHNFHDCFQAELNINRVSGYFRKCSVKDSRKAILSSEAKTTKFPLIKVQVYMYKCTILQT